MVQAALVHMGLLSGDAPTSVCRYIRRDGSPGEVDQPASVVADALPGPDDPVVVQVSRWDRLKDMIGVMRGFAEHVAPNGPGWLILAGPSVEGVTDDPEGAMVFAETLAQWHSLPPTQRSRVVLTTLPMTDVDENAAMVNALQRHATVIVQKSLAEGFGLTVAEGMWKGRPVVGSAVGGIQDQMADEDRHSPAGPHRPVRVRTRGANAARRPGTRRPNGCRRPGIRPRPLRRRRASAPLRRAVRHPHIRDAAGTLGRREVRKSPPATLYYVMPSTHTATAQPRTYEVRTYGCQMNAHDSERISGLLEQAGYVRATSSEGADVVVFNTCAVRENADNRLYGNLGHLAPGQGRPSRNADRRRRLPGPEGPGRDRPPGAVGGRRLRHAQHRLAAGAARARPTQRQAEVEILESLEVFPSTLPTRRESTYAGWVSISVGCNNTCTFCIVPSLRGREKDRRPGDVLAEVRALVAEGVLEVTLLGQNVNSYGVEFGDRYAFGKLLRSCGSLREDGLERVRFTSPHPKDFTSDVIAAMAETPNVCHSLHMPLQSGSDSVLKAMRRSYRSDKYLRILDEVRAAMPDAAITTDIIVGFPGETEADFQSTLDVVRAARFSSAFTFQYSKRPGTPAATMDDQVPKEVVQERYERLIASLEELTWDENKKLVGSTVEVLAAVGEGRKDGATGRMSGRARDGRLIHFASGDADVRPGDIVRATVTYAAPHHLNADGPLVSHRRTRAGDAWVAGRAPRTPGVSLGMPTIGAPPSAS